MDASLVVGATIPAGLFIGSLASERVVAAAVALIALECGMAGCEAYQKGATPGKRLLGLRVVDEDAARLRFRSALLRNAVKWAPLNLFGVFVAAMFLLQPADVEVLRPPLFMGAYGLSVATLFAVGLGQHRQSLHDSVAGSIVILRNPPRGTRFASIEQLMAAQLPPGGEDER